MAIVVASFAALLTDPALGAALVQRPAIDERDRSTVFWLAVGIGGFLTVLGIAASPLVADFFGEPKVRDLFAVASVCFVVIGLSVAHRALLLRRLAYRSLEIREMLSLVTGALVAILVAVAGFGPWAIIWNFVAYSVMSTALVWLLLDWRPRLTFSVGSMRKLGGFSLKIFAATVLSWEPPTSTRSSSAASSAPPRSVPTRWPTTSRRCPCRSSVRDPLAGREPGVLAHPGPEGSTRAGLAEEQAHVGVGRRPDARDPPRGRSRPRSPRVRRPVDREHHAASLAVRRSSRPGARCLELECLAGPRRGGAVLRLIVLTSCVSFLAFPVGLTWGIVGVAASYAVARWLLVVPTTWLTTRRYRSTSGPACVPESESCPSPPPLPSPASACRSSCSPPVFLSGRGSSSWDSRRSPRMPPTVRVRPLARARRGRS